nr:hypothetical protein [Elusimicrobiota bacterium]
DLIPLSPLSPQATAGIGSVSLSWTAPNIPDIDEYNIYQDSIAPAGPDLDYINIASTGATSYVVTGLTNFNTYYFRITTVDLGVKESTRSAVVSAMPNATLPSGPTGFNYLNVSSGSIRWQWTDNANNEIGYRVKATTDNSTIYDTFAPVSGTGATTSWVELNLVPNTSYYRYVQAYNAAGSSSTQSGGTFTLAAVPAGVTAKKRNTGNIFLEWTSNGNPSYTRYGLSKSTVSDFSVGVDTFVVISDGLTDLTTGAYNLNENSTYYFRVWAYNELNSPTVATPVFSTMTAGIAPAAVNNLTAFSGNSAGELKLKWTAPGDDGTTGTITNGKYNIKWATYSSVSDWASYNNKTIEFSTSVTFGETGSMVITGLNQGFKYYINVRAADEVPLYGSFTAGVSAFAQGSPGSVEILDSGLKLRTTFYTVLSSAVIRITDIDRNKNYAAAETISGIQVVSSSGSVTFSVVESALNSSVFISTVNIAFSTAASQNNNSIKVYDGATVTVRYIDNLPAGTTSYSFIWYEADKTKIELVYDETGDYIRGYSGSVSPAERIKVFNDNDDELNFSTTSVSDGSFRINVSENFTYGSLDSSGNTSIYVRAGGGRVDLIYDVKCIVDTAKIDFDYSPWGDGTDYLVGSDGAIEPDATIKISADTKSSDINRMSALSMINTNSITSVKVGASGSFSIAVGDKFKKYSVITATVTDTNFNYAIFKATAQPAESKLLPAAPNPFVVSSEDFTVINYDIARPGDVSLKVYNIAGELVKTLVESNHSVGSYYVRWYGDNGRPGDDVGKKVGSGVYIYVISAPGLNDSGKVILVR